MLCKCKHPDWYHTKHSCTGSVRICPEKPELGIGVYRVIPIDQIDPKYHARIEKRGYVSIDCDCPGLRTTIEVGKMPLYGPGGQLL